MKRPGAVWLIPALALAAAGCVRVNGPVDGGRPMAESHALQSITLNTGAYAVTGLDRRSVSIVAPVDMHIVSISHFTGVQSGTVPSDNGHLLSLLTDNPWEKWANDQTGMEPTGQTGYFGYCGRDYYTECAGIQDVQLLENLPAGTHFLVRKGERLYLHCYACHGQGTRMFHHAVRLYYW
jgi:hypothetical protein